MKVHNLMEEYVAGRVIQMYEQLDENRPAWLTCNCENCKLDVICYVLNRIQPRYIVSGRGIVHAINHPSPSQIRADVDALIIEGIRVINTVKRPYHKDPKHLILAERMQPLFNFPVIIGTIYDGSTFAPLSDATITLKYNDLIVDMVDKTWTNPCNTYEATKGSYSFWVKPFKAEQPDINKYFTFTIEVAAENYTSVSHAFSIPVTSNIGQNIEVSSSYSLKIQDLFLFREDIETPME
ncbi:MAG: late competence development ComFB family protein [Treponema sp.]|nr:late competence development ComFB family protein [Treponema sp.]